MPPKRVSMKGRGADIFFGDAGAADELEQNLQLSDGPTELHHEVTTSVIDLPDVRTHEPDLATPDKPVRRRQARKRSPDALPDSANASVLASTLGVMDAALVDSIRRIVKVVGREVSFVRLTSDEKGQLAEIIYSYKRRGIKTSENEINRIAVNFLLSDYREHGEQSILARVLDALRA